MKKTAALVTLLLVLGLTPACDDEDGAPSGQDATMIGETGVTDPDSAAPDQGAPDAPLPSCTDKKKNGGETDVDCGGGTCPACADSKKCGKGSDCTSGVCSGGICAAPTCTDKVKNGSETDADCGGGTCAACANGKKCAKGSDCTSLVCKSGLCAAPSCTDKVNNGAETDIDCGGGTCSTCADGKKCAKAGDCKSGVCTGGVCTAAGGCKDGTREGFKDKTKYPKIAACGGKFSGYIDQASAQSICSTGWHVCRGSDKAIVGKITYAEARSFSGCFAYDTAHDCSACYPTCRKLGCINGCVKNYTQDADMGGMGSGCSGWSNQKSCLASGRVDASTNTFGCKWNSKLAGVICCKN